MDEGREGNHHVHHFNVRVLSFLLRALYISPICSFTIHVNASTIGFESMEELKKGQP